MSADRRLCPLCDAETDQLDCARHGVPTVPIGGYQGEPVEIRIGMTIAHRYRIDAKLGEGAFGAVYKATQLTVQRPVALKLIKAEIRSKPNLIKRFYREAQASSAVDHPNIIGVVDFGLDQDLGVPYLAMAYVEGQTLGALLRSEGALPERRAARILGQVAKALVAAHVNNIIHRDLKPENIMVTQMLDGDEHVRVLDFGIAKMLGPDDAGATLTAQGTAIGTPHYMSPEQAGGDKVDFRSDLYSLGCILHTVLTLETLFAADSVVALMNKQVTAPPPPLPDTLVDGMPPSTALVQLRDELLAKHREDRPSDTTVVVARLRAIAEGPPQATLQRALGTKPTQSTPPPVHAEVSQPRPSLPAPLSEPIPGTLASAAIPTVKRPIRKRWFIGGALWLVAIAVFLVLPRFTSRRPEPTGVAGITAPPPPPPEPVANPAGAIPAAALSQVQLTSVPAGAAVVSADGTELGRTPLAVTVPTGETHAVTLSQAGFVATRVALAADDGAKEVVLEKVRDRAETVRPATRPPVDADGESKKALRALDRKIASAARSRGLTTGELSSVPKTRDAYSSYLAAHREHDVDAAGSASGSLTRLIRVATPSIEVLRAKLDRIEQLLRDGQTNLEPRAFALAEEKFLDLSTKIRPGLREPDRLRLAKALYELESGLGRAR